MNDVPIQSVSEDLYLTIGVCVRADCGQFLIFCWSGFRMPMNHFVIL